LPKQAALTAQTLRQRPISLDESLAEGQLRDVLVATWPFPQQNHSVLLHGDYWPGNVLWREGQLVAVVDWEDAAVGDPLADLANSRLELLWAFGVTAMEAFTAHYHALRPIDLTYLPYWDLWAALRPAGKLSKWGVDPDTEKGMREGHRIFINQAFEQLATTPLLQ
jgi:Ser/Thr protein kinase RdoA (MazF antagonist)